MSELPELPRAQDEAFIDSLTLSRMHQYARMYARQAVAEAMERAAQIAENKYMSPHLIAAAIRAEIVKEPV